MFQELREYQTGLVVVGRFALISILVVNFEFCCDYYNG